MKFAIFIIVMLLFTILGATGCVDEVALYEGDNNALLIGDSNCTSVRMLFDKLSYVVAGISADCHRGRTLVSNFDWPDKPVIFLALGVNDAMNNGDDLEALVRYQDKLIWLMDNQNGDVYCVLPVVSKDFEGFSVEDYRDSMHSFCLNTIDPLELGVTVGAGDGIHWNITDQGLLGAEMKRIVESY